MIIIIVVVVVMMDTTTSNIVDNGLLSNSGYHYSISHYLLHLP
jgi:hypothetical protein